MSRSFPTNKRPATKKPQPAWKNPNTKPKPTVKKTPTLEVFLENNFFHQHALTVLTVKAEDGIGCDVCGTLVHDEVYGYKKHFHTKFYMHKICLNLPRTIYHPAHLAAPLNLRAHSSKQGEIKCKCCNSKCDSFHYHSSDNFNLHIRCAARPSSVVYNQNTSLYLRYNFPLPAEHSTDKCTICKKSLYSGWVYDNNWPKIIAHYYCVRNVNGFTAITIHKRLSGLVSVPSISSSSSTSTSNQSLLSVLFGYFKT